MTTSDSLKLLFVWSILIIFLFNMTHNRETDQKFQEAVSRFMIEGPRNTSEQGKALCMRINALEIKEGIAPSDCKKLYR